MQNLENAASTARASVSFLMGIALLAVLALAALQSVTTGSLSIAEIAVFGGLAAVIWMTGRAAHKAMAVLRQAVRSGAQRTVRAGSGGLDSESHPPGGHG